MLGSVVIVTNMTIKSKTETKQTKQNNLSPHLMLNKLMRLKCLHAQIKQADGANLKQVLLELKEGLGETVLGEKELALDLPPLVRVQLVPDIRSQRLKHLEWR